jgi:hypothetical protein
MEGFEAFDLHLPPAPLTPGKMDGGLGIGLTILDAVISGVTHFTSERAAQFYEDKYSPIEKLLGKVFSKSKDEVVEVDSMGVAGPAEEPGRYKVIVSDSQNGVKSVTAYNENGAVNIYSNREYSIDPELTYAILIGTGEYDDRSNFSPIPPVAGNVDEMYRILTDKTLVGLPFDNITRLYNESCINIKNELRNVSRAKDIKTLIIYYAGHGQNTGNNQLSLIAKDTRTIDDELHNDIPYSFVERMMNSSQADQKIVFIDACHSGLAAQGSRNVFDFEPVLGTFTLASTSADDSSYFKKDAPNTYFTQFLADAFKNGIANSNKMLSLTDLYDYTSQKLSKMHMPEPVCKKELKNIAADKFYISGNPSFSLEARLGMPKQLYQQGRYDEARREYILLEKEYPDNQQLRNEHLEFERNSAFNRLVKEGDVLFYNEKKYREAQAKYREALAVKYDENVRDKIADCENNLVSQMQTLKKPVVPAAREPVKKVNDSSLVQNSKLPPKKKSIVPVRFGILAVALLTGLYLLLSRPKHYSFEEEGIKYSYTGGMTNGKPEGKGRAEYNNGNVYEGDWSNGIREGSGTFTWANGAVYKGFFKNNRLNGKGTCDYKNGDVYDGYWSFGTIQGDGVYKYKNGNVADGRWFNNRLNGYGTYTWFSTGDKYEGNFKDDMRDGAGTYTSASGDLYNAPNCRKYIGSWRNGFKDGFGRCFDGSGKLIYEGYFRNDLPVQPYPNR